MLFRSGNPWIFQRAEALISEGRMLPSPEVSFRMEIMIRHIRLLCQNKGERIGMREARRHAAWYMKGLNGAAALRSRSEELAEEAVRLNQAGESQN